MPLPRNSEYVYYIDEPGSQTIYTPITGDPDDEASPVETENASADESTGRVIPGINWNADSVVPVGDGTGGTEGVTPPSYPNVPVDPIPAIRYKTIIRKSRVAVENFDPEALEALQNQGIQFIAVYTDGTEDEVDWTEVYDPRVTSSELVTFEADNIGAASNQHFWKDNNGAHVTDDTQSNWNIEYSMPGHGTLANPTDIRPWHNILMNSLGILLRRGLINLVSMSKSAIAFYDGSGNQNENITAFFGRNNAQIGRSTENHIILDNEGITAYDGEGNVAPLQASNIAAAEADIDHLQADTADIATIRANSAKVANLTADALTAATAYIAALNAASVTANDISADKATIADLITGSVTTSTLKAASAYISALNAAHVTANDISADKAVLAELISGDVTATTLRAASAYIELLEASGIDADDLSAASAYIDALTASNITAQNISADHATVGTISADYLKAADMQAEVIRVGQLLANYVQTDFSNVNVAWIQNGTIKDGAITNAMINSVSANKLTAGTIDASKITVTNLTAEDISVKKINGQTVTGKNLTDALSQHESDISDLDDKIDTQVEALNDRIDGAIETFTGTAVPTLNNTPASGWNTTKLRDQHVGDVYYVVNSNSQQNGYCYRFTKSGSNYSWQLIKDSDVTAALSRLQTAEGKIGTIEQFDSDISAWKTDTDEELASMKSAHNTLAGRVSTAEGTLATKVDTTTFNTLSQTVEGNRSSIQSLTNEQTELSGLIADTQETVANISIGGRNLVWDTAWNNTGLRWQEWGSPSTREIVENNGRRWLHVITSSRYQGYQQPPSYRNGHGEISGGDVLTVSAVAYAAAACAISIWGIHWNKLADNGSSTIVSQSWFTESLTTEPKRFTETVTVPDGVTGFNIMVGNSAAASVEIWIADVKLERGNKATDWTPAPEDVEANALASGIEYIAGTQTAATNLWTGKTKESALVAGKSIAYRLPYAGTGTAATLNLTLSSGGTTGAKAINMPFSLSSNSASMANITTHYPAGSVIPMTYDGAKWVVNNYNTNIDHYDRVVHNNALKAASANASGKSYAIVAESLIGYIESLGGYQTIVAGSVVDLRHPILWGPANVAANATFANAYEILSSRSLRNNFANFSGTAYYTVYIYGTLVNNSLTVVGATTTIPVTEDGYVYIPLGQLYSEYQLAFRTSTAKYAYLDGAFQPVEWAVKTQTARTITKVSEIEHNVDGITTRVGSLETTTTKLRGDFDNLEIGGRGTWYADWPRPVTAVELGYLSEKKYIEEAGFVQDFSKKFCMRVDFMRNSAYQTQRYCLASSFGMISADTGAAYPEISIELAANSGRLRIYSTSDDGATSDKIVGTAPELDIWSTILVWWDPETKEITWLLVSGDRSETGHYAPSGTYSRKSGLIRLGADNRVNNTWNVKYYQRDMPPIWYEEPPEDPENLCRWSLTETTDGNPKNASPVECSSGNASIDAAKVEIETVSNRLTTVEQNVSGITTRVSDVESTTTTLRNDLDGLEIGGRNLWGYGSQCESLDGMTVSGTWDITTEDGFVCAHATGAFGSAKYIVSKLPFIPKGNEYVTVSGYVLIKNVVFGTTNPMCQLYISGQTIDGRWRSQYLKAVYIDGTLVDSDDSTASRQINTYISDEKWHHVAFVYQWENFNFTSQCSPSVYFRDCTGDLYVRHLKYERGNKATDWSPAPEDTNEYVSQRIQSNLAPFLSMPIEDIYNASTNPDGYWKTNRTSDTTQLADGWAHIERNNTGTSTVYPTFYESAVWRNAHGGLKPNEIYTVLIEIRNAVITGNVTISGITAHTSTDRSMFSNSSESVLVADGVYYVTANTKDDTAASNITNSTRALITMPAGSSIACDLRMSLYEGRYFGPYKPYIPSSEALKSASDIKSITTRVSQAESTIEQHSDSIALKANSADVYTKQQSDGLISTEVTNRNAAITAATNAINLSVSKVEKKAETIDGNILYDTDVPSLTKIYGPANRYFSDAGNASFMVCSICAIENAPASGLDYMAHWSVTDSTSNKQRGLCFYSGNYIQFVTGQKYTLSCWVRCTSGKFAYCVQTIDTSFPASSGLRTIDSSESNTWQFVTTTVTANKTQLDRVYFMARTLADSLSFECDMCGFKLTAAAYATQTELDAAKAEIKVTTDGISSEVSKVSSAKYLVASNANGWPLSSIKTWAAEGYNGNWTVQDVSNVRVGDVVYVKGIDSTRNCDVYIKGTVTAINATNRKITMSSHGYEDVLPIDTIKSTINQSSDSVKIQARHVEIDGTAVFTNSDFQNKLTETIDAIEVGGRNLLLGTATQDISFGNIQDGVTETSETWLGCKVFKSSDAWKDMGFDFETQVAKRGLVKAGDVLTYSIWAKTDDTVQRDIYGVWMDKKSGDAHIYGNWISKLTNSWTRYEKQITVTQVMLDAATVGKTTRFECNTTCTSGKYIYWAAPKLEKGNKATDWTPAPEDQTVYVDNSVNDISIGGRNLFKSTTHVQKAGSGDMTISAYDSTYHGRTVNVISVTPVLRINNIIPETNVTYTISFTCTASAACRISIDIMDNVVQSFDVPVGTSKVVCTSTPYRAIDNTYHFIDIQFGAVGTYKLEDIMVEQATKASSWSPAPEDTEASIKAIEQGLGGFDILWNRARFSNDVDAGGECYLCAYDPTTATRTDANGWVMWNGTKRTVSKGMFNPDAVIPYNIPVYIVCRLSSETATTGTNYMVWYDSGWKYATMAPSAVGGNWRWAEATDMVLGKFVEPGSEVAFTECETYRQPLKWGAITTDTVTARSAQATANAAAPKTQAVKRTQRIYYRSNSTTKPATPGTASSNWVTKEDDSTGVWTKMHISISTTHKYIYTCEQYEFANGTVGYTTVLLDNTITVIDGGNIITGSVTANQLAANSVIASKIAAGAITAQKLNIGDTANYSNLDINTADYYGFTYDSTSTGRWFTMKTLKRDTPISPQYDCKGGEKFQVSFEVSSTVMGRASQSATSDSYLGVAVGLYCVNGVGTNFAYPISTMTMSSSAGTATIINCEVTLNADAKAFYVAIQLNGWHNVAPMSGTFKIRNLKVYKKIGGELIVDGSITADKIATNAISIGMVTDLETTLNGKQATGDYATKTQAQAYVNNLEIGGRNLARATPHSYAANAYYVYNIPTTVSIKDFEVGDSVTIQLWGVEVDANSSGVHVYWGGGDRDYTGPVMPDANGYIRHTHKITQADYDHSTAANKRVQIYNFTRGHEGSSLSIERWKIERGSKATDWTPAPEDQTDYVDNSIDNLQIGGRNLLRGTSTMTVGNGGWDTTRTFRASGGTLSSGTSTELPLTDVFGSIRVTNTETSTASQIGIAQDRVKGLVTGETYTQSAWVRASTTLNVRHQPIWKSASQVLNGEWVSVGTDWTFVSYTGVLTGEQATDFYSAGYVYAQNVPANGWFEVCGLKLEKGDKPTDWSPAPEDVALDATNKANEAAKTASNYIYADSSGIRIASASPSSQKQRLQLTNSAANFYTSDDIQRIGINSSSGVTVGNPAKGRVVVTDAGITIYDTNSKKRAAVGTGGLTVYDASEVDVGNFGATARLGKSNNSRFLMNADSLQAYNSSNVKYFEVSASGMSFGSNAVAKSSDIPTTVAELSDSSSYLTTTAASNSYLTKTDASSTYATSVSLTNEVGRRKAIYGTCATAAGTASKAVTLANYELDKGKIFTVKFTYANTKADKIQLNVNSTGTIDVWAGGAVTGTDNQLLWAAGAEVSFYYDGAEFVVVNEPRSWYGSCATATGTAAKTDTTSVGNCVICRGTKMILAMTNTNSNTAPTLNIRSTGAKAIYAGTGTTRPLVTNGLSWAAGFTQEFIFDGAAWRVNDTSASSNYVAVDATGIKIHLSGNSSTYQHQTASGTTFYVSGKKRSAVLGTGLHVYIGDDETEAASFTADGALFKVGGKKRSVVASDGLHVYVESTETEVAKFTSNGARIGSSETSHIDLDYHSMKLIDNSDSTYLHVSDLRESNGTVQITETFNAPISQGDMIYLGHTATNKNYTVTIHTSQSPAPTVDTTNKRVDGFRIYPGLTDGYITATYTTSSEDAKVFSFGTRATNSVMGSLSSSFGKNVIASGRYSHAEGENTIASGYASHAEGYNSQALHTYSYASGYNSKTSAAYQTVIGSGNVDDSDALFIIGNGSGVENAFSVHSDGSVNTYKGPLYTMLLLDVRSYVANDTSTWTLDIPYNSFASAGYTALLFKYVDVGGNEGYKFIYGPFDTARTFNVTSMGVDRNVGLVFRSKTYLIPKSTKQIAVAYNDGYAKYGRATLSNSGTYAWSYSNEISITHVYGIFK